MRNIDEISAKIENISLFTNPPESRSLQTVDENLHCHQRANIDTGNNGATSPKRQNPISDFTCALVFILTFYFSYSFLMNALKSPLISFRRP